MPRRGLRIDITLRDPISGKVYREKNVDMDSGVRDMYSFVAMKYRGEKKRTAAIINKEMLKRK